MLRIAHFLLCSALLVSAAMADSVTTAAPSSSNVENTAVNTSSHTSPPTTLLMPTAVADNATESLPSVAAKLVRLRRQRPYTIVRHVYHTSKRTKPRHRIKRPKYKYSAPPSYNFGEPHTSYYKPKPHYAAPESNSYSVDNLEHLSVDAGGGGGGGGDYALHTSSYDGHSLDLDLYGHGDTHSAYDTPKYSSIEYTSYDAPKKTPTYSYAPVTKLRSTSRAPHRTYGTPSSFVPSNEHSSYVSNDGDDHHSHYAGADYESYQVSSHDKHQFEAPQSYDMHPLSSYEAAAPSYETKYEEYTSDTAAHAPNALHIPATKYGVPDLSIPLSYAPQSDYHPAAEAVPHSHNSYVVYDKKIPNSGYSSVSSDSSGGYHHFAEPPSAPSASSHPSHPSQQSSHTQVEISYAPSYEITLPTTVHKPEEEPVENYHSPTSTYQQHSDFGEPPSPPPSSHAPPASVYTQSHAPDYGHAPTHESAHPGHAADYLPPSDELPLNPHHMPPTYDYPKSSYQVPIYDPIPFEASSKDEHESYPPFDVVHHGKILRHAPEAPNKLEAVTHTQYYDGEHSTPTFDVNTSAEEPDGDTHLSGSVATTSTTNGYRSIYKRKRIRNSAPTSTIKHILDVPELEAAFEESQHHHRDRHQHKRYRPANANADTIMNESNLIETHGGGQESKYFLPTVPPHTGSDQYVSPAWNPMRIRTSTRTLATPTTTSTVAVAVKPISSSPKGRFKLHKQHYFKPQYRAQIPLAANEYNEHTVPTTPADVETEKVSIISIDESRSHSYYDGTVAPPRHTMPNVYETRLNRFTVPTRLPSTTNVVTHEDTTPHRTTKSVYETTYFKSPRNEQFERHLSTLGQNLPKNHKLY